MYPALARDSAPGVAPVPLLFAATLFVSASLLFMVQPMVGKLVLPLLGGSPAVWNACMVFFQALLLLGYLYADRLTRQPDARKQWVIHIGVMVLPVTAFALAILFGSRGTPIAVAESLAPMDGSSAILSVLAILTIAIGIPFFVVSTSATLLQKWFTYTGHPSARDPYFLYSASNAGSLISLLGYPIFIEPNMTQGNQTWFFALGFLGLFALITFCGRAAANPLGVPPGASLATATGPTPQLAGGKSAGKQGGTANKQPGNKPQADNKAVPIAPPTEPPPSLARMAKWTVLAFVPSSLMLGVTFHMTTDIASIPLLWVGPLALYLVTFIIAFGKTPPWFRILIGNLAPVMILLLVFLLISGVNPGVGLSLLLHMLTFFAAALMCHYELARDRPSPQYLTTYFLIMSFGGVLGGIFNSLLAPILFAHSYEYRIALNLACLMVPHLNPLTQDDKEAKMSKETALVAEMATGKGLNIGIWFFRLIDSNKRLAIVLDIVIPVVLGVVFWQLQKMPSHFEWYRKMLVNIADLMPWKMGWNTVYIVITYAFPVMVCFFFVDRPLRFALAVAAILWPITINEAGSGAVYTERSFFGILKIEENPSRQLLVDRTQEDKPAVYDAEGKPIELGRYEYRRLVHGTTLHGTQVSKHDRHILDDFQFLTAAHPLENLAVMGAVQNFDMRQEPLTYYHRTGPVGAMFDELKRTGKDKAWVAMVGLGTGSVSCYAQKGQNLTFYEIDPAVKKLVADTDKYFTYVSDAEKRGAKLDFRMGDARLMLKQDTDRKYQLLLVDAFSSDSIPVHLLTNEAVALYLDRLTDDGILALHISNKFVKLEPVVAAIAKHHNLVARVWNDDAEGRHGKTASSWVVLARKREHLGDRLCSPIADYMVVETSKGPMSYTEMPLMDLINSLYPEVKPVMAKATGKQQEALLNWLDQRTSDPQAQQFARWIRKYGTEYVSLMKILQTETGYGFRPVDLYQGVDAWTDDYADVMRVMMIPELQAVRKFFGLPTPVER
jgi:hypothetical protein